MSLNATKKASSSDKKEQMLSLMFIHYLLHKNILIEVIETLLNDEKYLNLCYEPQSIMRNSKLIDDLTSNLSLLFQFNFDFDISDQQQNSILIAHPLSRLKITVKHLIEMFIVSRNENLNTKRKEILDFIKGQLHSEIYSIFIFGYNQGTVISGKIYLWNMIEEACVVKKESAMDYGGIYLPHCVRKINKITRKKPSENINDTKFKLFIIQALFDHSLADYVESIFHFNSLARKRYPKKSIIYEKSNLLKMCKMLDLLSKLEFPFRTEILVQENLI
jgi:hypothetical protein